MYHEIQNVESWEKVVNSLGATKNTSIFITGSNSDFLSSNLATHIAGRFIEDLYLYNIDYLLNELAWHTYLNMAMRYKKIQKGRCMTKVNKREFINILSKKTKLSTDKCENINNILQIYLVLLWLIP